MREATPTVLSCLKSASSLVLGAAVLFLFAPVAEAAKVRVLEQEGFDYQQIHTYDFFLHESRITEGAYASVLYPRLRALIVEGLAKKGFERDTENPDFMITFDGALSDSLNMIGGVREVVTENVVWVGIGPGPGVPDWTSQGVLVIRMHEPGEEEPFWGGGDALTIGGRLDTERIWKKVRKAANRILAKFPSR